MRHYGGTFQHVYQTGMQKYVSNTSVIAKKVFYYLSCVLTF